MMKTQTQRLSATIGVVFCALVGVPALLHATDITWANASGGDWGVALNWNPPQVPGPTDRAILPLFVVVTVSSNTTVGNLDLSSSTLGGSATLTVSGTMNWTGGTMNGGGTTVIAEGATLAISGNSGKSIGPRTIDNNGTVTLTGGNVTGLSYGTMFNNASNAVVDFQGDASLLAPYGGTNIFFNTGTVQKSGGTGTSQLGFTLNNEGSVNARSGTLSLTGSGDSHGSFGAQSTATLDFSGSIITLESNSTVNAAAGTVSFSGNAHVEINGGYTASNTVITAGTANFNSPSVTGDGAVNSTLGGSGILTVNGVMTWMNGTMNGGGTTLIANGATLAISGGNAKSIGPRTIENHGTVTLTGGIVSALSYGATFDNATNGVVDFQGDASLAHPYGGTAIFDNAGTVLKSGGIGTSVLAFTFNNDGAVTLQSGTLSLSGGGDSHGSFGALPTATLEFAGNPITLETNSTVDAASGTVRFSGSAHVDINGSYAASDTVISGGSANFNGVATTGNGILNATLGGSGTFTVNGTMTWTNGTMNGGGTTAVADGATLAVGGSSTRDLGSRTFDNRGTLTISGGTLRVLSVATVVLNNTTNGLVDFQGDASFTSPFTGTGTVNNDGTFQKSGGTGTSTLAFALNNDGTVTVQSGTLSLSGSGDSHGMFSALSTATLDFAGSSITLETNSMVDAASGTVSFSGSALVDINGSYTASNTVLTAGTANFNDAAATGDAALGGGRLGGSGTFTANGAMTWTAGRMEGSGTTALANTAALTVSGASTEDFGSRTIENSGRMTIGGTGDMRVLSGAVVVVNNTANGLLDFQEDTSFLSTFGGTGTINNAGTVQKSGGTGVSTVGLALDNSGTMDVQTGTLLFEGPIFANETSGIVQGVGTLDIAQTSFTADGTVNPGDALGTLTIAGNLPQSSNGVINVELGGTTAGTNYDRLDVTGSATLHGTLNVSLANGFHPSGSDTFEIIKYASHTGFFDSISGLDLGGGFYLEPTFTSTNLILTTVDSRPRPTFSSTQRLPNGNLDFTLTTVAGQTFDIEATTNFMAWDHVLTITNAGAVYDLIVTDQTNHPYRFYRTSQP